MPGCCRLCPRPSRSDSTRRADYRDHDRGQQRSWVKPHPHGRQPGVLRSDHHVHRTLTGGRAAGLESHRSGLDQTALPPCARRGLAGCSRAGKRATAVRLYGGRPPRGRRIAGSSRDRKSRWSRQARARQRERGSPHDAPLECSRTRRRSFRTRPGRRVERRERLVEDEHARLHRSARAERDALLLAAEISRGSRRSSPRSWSGRGGVPPPPRPVLDPSVGARSDVLPHGEVREEREALRHVAMLRRWGGRLSRRARSKSVSPSSSMRPLSGWAMPVRHCSVRLFPDRGDEQDQDTCVHR